MSKTTTKAEKAEATELATVAAPPPLKAMVLKAQEQIAEVLPTGTDRMRFLRVAMMVLGSEDFASCTLESRLVCIMDAARLGLDFAPALGEAYPVPFGDEVVMIPGYRGLQKLARNTDGIEIESRCVYHGDSFDWWEGTDPRIEHKPATDGNRSDDTITHVYAIASFKDGRRKFMVMDRAEVETVRSMSKAKNSLMWSKRWREGARKTVVRNLCKYLPMAAESPLARAIEADDREYDMGPVELPAMPEGRQEFGFKGRKPAAQEPIEAEAEPVETTAEPAEEEQQAEPEPEESKKKPAPKRAEKKELTVGEQRHMALVEHVQESTGLEFEAAAVEAAKFVKGLGYDKSVFDKESLWTQIVWPKAIKHWSKEA